MLKYLVGTMILTSSLYGGCADEIERYKRQLIDDLFIYAMTIEYDKEHSSNPAYDQGRVDILIEIIDALRHNRSITKIDTFL